VLEENADVRTLAVAMLQNLGHVAIEAEHGVLALERLGEARFDVLLADQSLPEMSGTEVATKALERTADLAVIIASGYDGLPPTEGRVRERIVFLPKPYDQDSLERALVSARSVVN
jgi:CheY-like chemotaxis protein